MNEVADNIEDHNQINNHSKLLNNIYTVMKSTNPNAKLNKLLFVSA